MPLMCVTCRQIRFVWILVPPHCSVSYKQHFALTHSRTHKWAYHSVNATRVFNAWTELNEILSHLLSSFIRNNTHMSNERSISRMGRRPAKHRSRCIDVHGQLIDVCMSYVFPHFKLKSRGGRLTIMGLCLELTRSIELDLLASRFHFVGNLMMVRNVMSCSDAEVRSCQFHIHVQLTATVLLNFWWNAPTQTYAHTHQTSNLHMS